MSNTITLAIAALDVHSIVLYDHIYEEIGWASPTQATH